MIKVSGIYRKYMVGGKPFFALRKTSFILPSKGMVAIYGKSGSGKTTLLNLLSGLDEPSGGTIYYQGEPLTGKNKKNYLGKEVGFVFQHYNLIDHLSAMKNIALPGMMSHQSIRKVERKAISLLKKVGLKGFEHRNVDTLSGGEKQRVAICRALVNDPSIVFADEPTGALDERSAFQVMELLKKVSKERLVVFVSHNPEFVSAYGEIKIHVEEGKATIDNPLGKDKKKKRQRRRGHGSGWIGIFAKRNLKRNAKKNALCLLAGTIGFVSTLLTIGFYQGSETALKHQQSQTLGYQVAYLSEEEKVNLPNSPLTLVKQKRPSLVSALDAFHDIDSLTFEYDLSTFLPDSMAFSMDDERQDPVRFFPVYDLSLSEGNRKLLSKGEAPNKMGFHEVLVNQEFVARYQKDVLGKVVEASHEVEIHNEKGTEKVYLDYSFVISGIVSELSFMNEPRIYYSYLGLQNYLGGIELEKTAKKENYTLLDFLGDQGDESSYLNYRFLLFIHDFERVEDVFARSKELDGTSLRLESSAFTVAEAFSSLMEAFASSLTIVVALSLVGLGAILAMMAFSSFVSRKKEVAVLLSLGARRDDVAFIFGLEAGLICLLASLLALALASPLANLANHFLQKNYGFAEMIVMPWKEYLGIPYVLLFGLPLIAAFLGFLLGAIPIVISSSIPLSEELRDE